MGIVFWIVWGALAGLLGFRLVGDKDGQGCLTNVVIGIGGGMLGGSLMSIATGEDLLFSTSFPHLALSFVSSVLGSALLIWGLRAAGRRG
jgi:uncharacterized membrane protein YeaQ/YmgE (transglycosylase-associated protein family)